MGLNRVLLFGAVLVVAITACGPGRQTAVGFVVDVRSTSITQVDQFTLQTQEGQTLVFRIGRLELDGGAFPPQHLREHMLLRQGVAVAYSEENGQRVAHRLEDALWLNQ